MRHLPDEEKEAVTKERKAESFKHGASRASSSKEEEEEEESEEEEDAEEGELVGSSGVSSKAKGKGCAK